MDRSESIAELAKALTQAQAAIEPAPKEANNPHFKRKYADLTSVWEVCRGPLSANGLAVVQTPEPALEGGISLRTTLMHASGEWISSTTPLLFDHASMQSLGSAITYARRYALSAMVGVVSDTDDDAEGAGMATQHRPREQAPPARSGHGDHRGHAEAPRPAQNGHGGGGERKPYDGPDRPPTNGRALFAWTKEQEQRHEVGLLKYINNWSKLQDFPARMVDWDADQVAHAYAEAVRKLQAVGPAPDHGDAYEDALAN